MVNTKYLVKKKNKLVQTIFAKFVILKLGHSYLRQTVDIYREFGSPLVCETSG